MSRESWLYYSALMAVYLRTGQRASYESAARWRRSLNYQAQPGDLRAVLQAKADMVAKCQRLGMQFEMPS